MQLAELSGTLQMPKQLAYSVLPGLCEIQGAATQPALKLSTSESSDSCDVQSQQQQAAPTNAEQRMPQDRPQVPFKAGLSQMPS